MSERKGDGKRKVSVAERKKKELPAARCAYDNIMRLDHDAFLFNLGKLYEANKDKHSVWVTLKRVEAPTLEKSRRKVERRMPSDSGDADAQPKCLVRATNGKRKISCLVESADVPRFQLELLTVLRAGADGLKRKPKASKKAKASIA